MAMTTFLFKSRILMEKSRAADHPLFEMAYPEITQWLVENDVSYRVAAFRWPDLIALLVRQRDIVVEFNVEIEDDEHAVMFKLFSGAKTDDA